MTISSGPHPVNYSKNNHHNQREELCCLSLSAAVFSEFTIERSLDLVKEEFKIKVFLYQFFKQQNADPFKVKIP